VQGWQIVRKYKNYIFDLDETLLSCNAAYLKCEKEFGEMQEDRTGISAESCIRIMNAIDLESIKLANGFNKERYPESYRATSYALDSLSGYAPNSQAAGRSYRFGMKVFNPENYPLFPGVLNFLDELVGSGANIALYTKGDIDVQAGKIKFNNLRAVFDDRNIHIVPRKSPGILDNIMSLHGFTVEDTLVVGDSMRDEISNAVYLGVDCAWVHDESKDKWHQYETATELIPTYTVKSILDLP
jgi:putative hydrolase of the HAD superfamily